MNPPAASPRWSPTLCATVLGLAVVTVGRSDDLDRYILSEIERQNTPGLALAVVQDGRVVKAQGYGLANLDHRVPVTADTVFQSGSVGKMFTAAAILLLAKDGRLELTDPIGKHLKSVPEHWRDVTVHHLLNHTSGIAGFPYGDRRRFDLRKDYAEDELVALAAEPPLEFPPGTKWSYSNTGYVLLGVIIHRVTGQPYSDFLQRRIFHPLDMKTARVIDEAAIIPNRAAGYERDGKRLRHQSWVSPTLNTAADGSLYLSVHDLAKWGLALDRDQLLSAENKARMWSPTRLAEGRTEPYGYGWQTSDFAGHRRVGHDGVWQGFVATYDRFPEDHLSIIILANAAETKLDDMRLRVAQSYLK